jgi:transcriptional regulator NrdR family protein
MQCIKCFKSTSVIDSRKINRTTVRRRKCDSCSLRFTTKEVVNSGEDRLMKKFNSTIKPRIRAFIEELTESYKKL